MKTLLLIAVLLSTAPFSFANEVVKGDDPVRISIQAKDNAEELLVDVSSDADGKVTLSVFSELGEIVVAENLHAGVNKVKVRHLRPGQYVAVVRHNDEFRQKQEFKVN